MSFKYGRKPPKNRPALPFAAVQDSLVAHPPAFDTIDGWTGWDMLKNDEWGDCVAVTWATVRRIVTRLAGHEVYPSLDQVLQVYKTQNRSFNPYGGEYTNGPGSSADQGMVIQTLLEYLVKIGGPDGVKALAFAKVDHTNLEELKTALYIFKFLWLGVNVTAQNENAFPNMPWDYSASYPVLGGHSITGTGYDETLFRMETWADEGKLTRAYMRNGVEEAWVVIWPEIAEHLTQEQKDALDVAYAEVTNGKHIQWPSAPTPVDEGPDQIFSKVLRRILNYTWVPKYFRTAALAWLASKGL
jgi:hypothetical protein